MTVPNDGPTTGIVQFESRYNEALHGSRLPDPYSPDSYSDTKPDPYSSLYDDAVWFNP